MKKDEVKVLVIEDEKNIADAINAYLLRENYKTALAYNGLEGLEYFKTFKPDLIILDLMLPELSGEEVCKRIRKTSQVLIIMLTAKTTVDDKVDGFTIGADDYLVKPFSPRELIARIKSLLRRHQDSIVPLCGIMSWKNDDLVINFENCTVKKKNQEVMLTANEFKILSLLAKHPNRVFSRENIMESINANFDIYDRIIDAHVKNIRAKIEDDRANPIYIITVRGIGYRFYQEGLEI